MKKGERYKEKHVPNRSSSINSVLVLWRLASRFFKLQKKKKKKTIRNEKLNSSNKIYITNNFIQCSNAQNDNEINYKAAYNPYSNIVIKTITMQY